MNDARGCKIEMEWGEWKWGCEDVKGVRESEAESMKCECHEEAFRGRGRQSSDGE